LRLYSVSIVLRPMLIPFPKCYKAVFVEVFETADIYRCTKKGHRYIVPYRGSLKPVQNTQAMPLLPGAPTFMRFCTYKT